VCVLASDEPDADRYLRKMRSKWRISGTTSHTMHNVDARSGGEPSKDDQANNAAISALRMPTQRLVANVESRRIFHRRTEGPATRILFVPEGFDGA
jgi:hypothetical protein